MYADPMLEKVFSNLVENSVVHGETVKKITISTMVDGSDMVVVYEDDGCGIPDGEKERIFDRGHGKNSGYGLYLSKEILSITGIDILENGRPGEGTRFEIRVPQGVYRVGNPSTKVSAERAS